MTQTKFYKNNKYNVLTDKGFRHFDGLQVSVSDKLVLIVTEFGHLYATQDHEFYYTAVDKKPIIDFNVGDILFSVFGDVCIKDLVVLDYELKVYDLIEVEDGNAFLITDSGIKVSNCCYIDEMAFIDNDFEFYSSTYPVVSSGDSSKIIITSTPNGMNYFYKLWHDSLIGENSYVSYKVHWSEHPKRGEEWYNKTLKDIGEPKFKIEYECEFSGSDGTLINGQKLSSLTTEKPIQILDEERIRIYSHPEPNKQYVLVADTAEGVGEDFSVISVFDVTTMPYRQVFVYQNNYIVPNIFATVIHQCATKYNEALVVVESNNSSGGIVLEVLWNELEYENLLMSEVKNSENVAGWGKRSQAGVRTTKRTKSVGCSYLKDLIETDQLLISDFKTVEELATFIRKANNTYEAKKGKHDDIVMTLVIFAWLTSQPYFHDVTGVEASKNLRTALRSGADDYSTVMGGIVDGLTTVDDSDDKMF